MNEPGTVFCLFPDNRYAKEIVDNPANRGRRREDPDDPTNRFLRIGLDYQPKTPPHLVRFGRRECNDVILNNRFSRNDQCYFDFNKESGELLLHDISEDGDTELYDGHGLPQIWKTPRKCVVVLTPDHYRLDNDDGKACDREWILKIRCAEFRLKPRTQGGETFTRERLQFAGQQDPERTYEGTIQRLITLGLQSLPPEALTTKPPSTSIHNPHNTRFRTLHQPEENDVIRYTKLRPLGSGGQGEVHKVVDMYTGDHHACKIVAIKTVPQWGIHSERDFKARVESEVNLVQKAKHSHIVPYTFTQGWKLGQSIEIFMPVYEGNLYKFMHNIRPQGQEAVEVKTARMLYHILLALDYVHTQNPPIIHRDVKPPNILFQGDSFFLTDFGIAKVVDASKTLVGTQPYMAPELWLQSNQTPKVDIYALGATVVECLEEFPPDAERLAKWPQQQLWHEHLQTLVSQHAPRMAPALASIDMRPTAHQLLRNLFGDSLHTSVQSPGNSIALPTIVSSSYLNLVNGATLIHRPVPSPMELTLIGSTRFSQKISQPTPQTDVMQISHPHTVTAQYTLRMKTLSNRQRQLNITRTNSVKFTRQKGKKSRKLSASSQNKRRARPQSTGVSKQTSAGRSKPSRSKSVIAKIQEMRNIEKDLKPLQQGPG